MFPVIKSNGLYLTCPLSTFDTSCHRKRHISLKSDTGKSKKLNLASFLGLSLAQGPAVGLFVRLCYLRDYKAFSVLLSSPQWAGLAFPVLQILNNYVQFEVSHGPSDVASVSLSRSRVTDGAWHHLLIELKSAKEGKDIKYLAVMTLDYGLDQVSWHPYPLWNRRLHWAHGRTVTPRVPGPPRALEDLGTHILGPPEFDLAFCLMLWSPASVPQPLSRRSAPGLRNQTLSVWVSRHRAIRAIRAVRTGFF